MLFFVFQGQILKRIFDGARILTVNVAPRNIQDVKSLSYLDKIRFKLSPVATTWIFFACMLTCTFISKKTVTWHKNFPIFKVFECDPVVKWNKNSQCLDKKIKHTKMKTFHWHHWANIPLQIWTRLNSNHWQLCTHILSM